MSFPGTSLVAPPPPQKEGAAHPRGDDGRGGDPPTYRERLSRSALPALSQDLAGNHAEHYRDSQRDQNHVVQISENRNEIGNQVNRTERVGDDDCSQRFRIPRHTGIVTGQVERADLELQPVDGCTQPLFRRQKSAVHCFTSGTRASAGVSSRPACSQVPACSSSASLLTMSLDRQRDRPFMTPADAKKHCGPNEKVSKSRRPVRQEGEGHRRMISLVPRVDQ